MLDIRPWRELYRCDDLLAARAVATSIAAMEFDVRVGGDEESDDEASDTEAPRAGGGVGAGPFVIEVPAENWFALAEVLDEIIDEQQEFDRELALRRNSRQSRVAVVIGVATFAEMLMIWRLMEP